MNLKLLAFMDNNKAKQFYIKIKDSYNDEYESFFNYFENTWLSSDEEKKSRYEFSL